MSNKRFHINLTTGEPGACRAEVNCPFGDLETDHFGSMTEARKAYENLMESGADIQALASHQRSAINTAKSTTGRTAHVISKPKSYFAKATITTATRDAMGIMPGSKNYDKLISDAKSRAQMATDYFNKGKVSTIASAIDRNSSPASAEVKDRTVGALAALRARRSASSASEASQIMKHAAPASNPGDALNALAARRSAGVRKLGFSMDKFGPMPSLG